MKYQLITVGFTPAMQNPPDVADLFLALYRPIVARLARRLGNRFDAEDCVMEAFLAYCMRPEPPEYTERWLNVVATNIAIRMLRERCRGGGLDELAVEPSVTQEQDRLLAASILRVLPTLDATVLGLKYLKDMSAEEIAANLSLRQSYVYKVLSRARELARGISYQLPGSA